MGIGLIQPAARARSRGAAAALTALGCLLLLAPMAEAKVKVSFSKRVLTVEGDRRDNAIRVFCGTDLNVKMNGRNPAGGPIACSRVAEVDVLAGEGNDRIDARGVNRRFAEAKFTGFGTGTGVAVLGGPGADRLLGSSTAFNLFFGGLGNDRASGGARRDILDGGPGGDQIKGHGGRDRLLGKGGRDELNGGDGRDAIRGGAGADTLRGEAGDDRLAGGPGNDRIYGGPGNDRLFGGFGKDLLVGGPGRDRLLQDPAR